jgi:hypothetical protein
VYNTIDKQRGGIMKVWQLQKATEVFEQFKNEGFVLDMWTYNEFLYYAFLGVDLPQAIKEEV